MQRQKIFVLLQLSMLTSSPSSYRRLHVGSISAPPDRLMRAGFPVGCGGKICSRTYLDGIEKARLIGCEVKPHAFGLLRSPLTAGDERNLSFELAHGVGYPLGSVAIAQPFSGAWRLSGALVR